MSQFEELLAQLTAEQEEQSTLAKAMPEAEGEDDEAIQAAAEGDDILDDELKDEEVEMLTKSMIIDGEEVEVIDAEMLVKSMHDLTGRVGAQEEALTKALTTTVELVKQQGTLIKSLSTRLDKISKQGAGRKAVLSIHEKPATLEPLAKSEGVTTGELLAKAQSAYDAKRITGQELTVVDVSLRQGEKIDHGLLMKIVSQ